MYPLQQNENPSSVNKFIDFDKSKNVFYDNLYLCEQKLVVKIPICKRLYSEKSDTFHAKRKLKIEPFNLTKYTYLTAY